MDSKKVVTYQVGDGLLARGAQGQHIGTEVVLYGLSQLGRAAPDGRVIGLPPSDCVVT